ncbi:MAG: cbb3-type cytochrome oxidase maturation protein [Gammaproteobacteria bacterium]|jgi:cbb3-type cytochrome oxidase maturation protein
MEVIYLLIPLSLILLGLIVWVFFWAVRSGQFDDMEGPAYKILFDDDEPIRDPVTPAKQEACAESEVNKR